MAYMETASPPLQESRSRELYERSKKVLPGGNSRHSIFFEPHPIYCASGEGCRVTDVDGVERLDFVNNFSSLIHGHGHPAVLKAAIAQARRVIAVGLPTQPEIELAELLVERIGSVEQVRFTNSGTEAVMMAVKAARAHTGRPAIAKFEGCYHGTYDPVEVSQAPPPDLWGPADAPHQVALSHGAPEGIVADTVVLPFNDVAAAARILEAHASRLAGILVDPSPAHLGYLQISTEMLSLLRSFASASGALLVADEVYSLRLGYHGAQDRFGFAPDLTVMGKIIGGGMPIGAVGGPASIMAVFEPRAPRVAHGGTYNANPLSTAAGLASMRALSPEMLAQLDELGDVLREGMRDIAQIRGVDLLVEGVGSLMSLTFGRGPVRNYRDRAMLPDHKAKMQVFHRAMLEGGVLITPQGFAILSTPMTLKEVSKFIAAADDALRRLD